MSNLDKFKIDLKALDEGTNVLTFRLDDRFFEDVEGPEVKQGDVDATLTIRKSANDIFELHFHTKGVITVACTRCLDDMELPVETDNSMTAKFGSDYAEDDDLVTVQEDTGILDVAWFFYEQIALNIPIQHVHETGKCNAAMIDALNEHSAARSSDGEQSDNVDPRWEALRKLKG